MTEHLDNWNRLPTVVDGYLFVKGHHNDKDKPKGITTGLTAAHPLQQKRGFLVSGKPQLFPASSLRYSKELCHNSS